MKNRRLLGVIIIALGLCGLLVSVCYDYNIKLGPLSFLCDFFNWFSLSALFRLLGNTFSFVMTFVARYFWMLAMIVVGLLLLKTKKEEALEDGEAIYTKNETTEEIEVEYKKTEEKEYKKEKSSFRLSRNLDDIKISGVCSGLAHLLDVDTTIIRIAVLFLGLAGGGNIFLIYILLAFLLPGEHLG